MDGVAGGSRCGLASLWLDSGSITNEEAKQGDADYCR